MSDVLTADQLRYLLRRPIAFHRVLADVAGSAAGGLFLSQLLYWSDRGGDEDGWIYKTIAEWHEETALTRREQERARDALVALGVLAVERRGLPARLYYRLDIPALGRQIASLSDVTNLSAAAVPTGLPDPPIQPARSDKHTTETTPETTQTPASLARLRQAVTGGTRLGRR